MNAKLVSLSGEDLSARARLYNVLIDKGIDEADAQLIVRAPHLVNKAEMANKYPELMGGWLADVMKGAGKLAKKAGKGLTKRYKRKKKKEKSKKAKKKLTSNWKKYNKKQVSKGKKEISYDTYIALKKRKKKEVGILLNVNADRISAGKEPFDSYSDYKKYKKKKEKAKKKSKSKSKSRKSKSSFSLGDNKMLLPIVGGVGALALLMMSMKKK